MIITYRSIIAFLNENKVITISINKYGEQYLDIVALAVIWCVCLISLFFLFKTLRTEFVLKQDNNNIQKKPVINKENYFYGLNSNIKLDNKKAPFIGYVSKSHNKEINRFKDKK